MSHDQRLNEVLNALGEYWRETAQDLARLHDLNESGQQRIEPLALEIAALQQELCNIQRDLPAVDALREEWQTALQSHAEQHHTEFAHLHTQNAALRQELLAQLQSATENSNQRLAQLSTQLETLDSTGKSLEQHTADLTLLRQELHDLQRGLPATDALCEAWQGALQLITQHGSQLDALNADQVALREQLSRRLQGDTDHHAQQVAQLAEELATVRENERDIAQNTAALSADLTALRQDLGNLQRELPTADATHEQQQQFAELAEALATVREAERGIAQNTAALTADLTALRQDLSNLQRERLNAESLRDQQHEDLVQALRNESAARAQQAPAESHDTDKIVAEELAAFSERFLAVIAQANGARDHKVEQLANALEQLRNAEPSASAAQLASARQEWQAALATLPEQSAEQIKNLHSETADLRAALAAVVQELNAQQQIPELDALLRSVDRLDQHWSTALEEFQIVHGQQITQLTADLATLGATLEQASSAPQYSAVLEKAHEEVEGLRQEMRSNQRNNSELERSLRVQLASAREKLDAQGATIATLGEQAQRHTLEVNEQIRSLTGLHQQEQAQRESTLTTLSKLNEQTARLEQQISTNQGQAAEALRLDQERLAALEKWLTTQAEQFGRFDPILRELHGQLTSTHDRLQNLESAETAELLNQQQQRLEEAEYALHEQAQALSEMEQTLGKLSTQARSSAQTQKILLGGLAAAGLAILGLLWVDFAG